MLKIRLTRGRFRKIDKTKSDILMVRRSSPGNNHSRSKSSNKAIFCNQVADYISRNTDGLLLSKARKT
jgi:hypothetical protein